MKQILLISGLSGAGKTSVTNTLEDLGYRCIDQFPSVLIPNLIDLIQKDAAYEYVAISVQIMDLEYYFPLLDNIEFNSRLILLDCDGKVLLNRYKFSRRIHPLLVSNMADTLEEAIVLEKEKLDKYRDRFEVIDTTNLLTKTLAKRILEYISLEKQPKLTLSFESFGFKNGVAQDADMIFDVRFLPNPYYIDELRDLTGNDAKVYDYVLSFAKTKEYLKMLVAYLDYVFEAYQEEEKSHLTIAIGCTGGQHRSASIVNYLFDHYQKRFNCLKGHRDIKS